MTEQERQIYKRFLDVLQELLSDFDYKDDDFKQLESFSSSLHQFMVTCAIKKDKGFEYEV